MKIDYLIVGLGLAGIALVEELSRRELSFLVFEDESQTSSLVAGGMYNPVVLKRFNPVWKGAEQLQVALPHYKRLEAKFRAAYDRQMDILRIFKSIEEQNNWYEACDKPRLKPFLEPAIEDNRNEDIKADFRLGRVKGTGRVKVRELVNDYRAYLESHGRLIRESFSYDKLEVLEKELKYKDHLAKRIVFCEGNGLSDNPYFNWLPLEGTKGELITIHAPGLKLKEVVKSAVFVMPLGNDLYKIGATFNWSDKTNLPTEQGREELLEKLKTVISCDFEVREHEAGVRPTTPDRRPLLGKHPDHPRLTLFNGLGTRGVMSSPLLAQQLVEHLENQAELDPEIDISRFRRFYQV
ncbi:MAG: FAD-binding oxidoreductase [Lutimonas sp.]